MKMEPTAGPRDASANGMVSRRAMASSRWARRQWLLMSMHVAKGLGARLWAKDSARSWSDASGVEDDA